MRREGIKVWVDDFSITASASTVDSQELALKYTAHSPSRLVVGGDSTMYVRQ